MDDLEQRVVQGYPVDPLKVQKDDIRLVSRFEATEPVEAQRPRAADGRRVERLGGRKAGVAASTVRRRDERGETRRFVHVLMVRRARAVGAYAHVEARVEHLAHVRDSDPEPQVAAGVVRERGAAVGEPSDIVVVEPDTVRRREAGSQHAEAVEPGRQGHAEPFEAGDRLYPRLREMGVKSGAVFPGQFGEPREQGRRAMVGDGGRDGETHEAALFAPVPKQRPVLVQDRLFGLDGTAFQVPAERRRQRVQEARNGVEDGDVGHHRGDHGAYADVGIRPRHAVQRIEGRQRQGQGQVVAGGAPLEHHLHRRDPGGQPGRLERQVGVDPGTDREEPLQGPAVRRGLVRRVIPVGVGVDEPRMQKLAARVDHDGVGGRRKAGRADVPNRIALDQQVAGARPGSGAVEHAPAPDDDRPSVGHPAIIPRWPRAVQGLPLPAGGLLPYP